VALACASVFLGLTVAQNTLQEGLLIVTQKAV